MSNPIILLDILYLNGFYCKVSKNKNAMILNGIRIGKCQDTQRVADMLNVIRIMDTPNIKINYCYQVSYFHYLEVTIHYTIA